MIKAFAKFSYARLFNLVVLLVIMAGTGILAVTVLKLGGRVDDLRRESAITKAEIENISALNNEFLRARSAIQRIESNEESFFTLVPTRNRVLRNIELLEQLAANTSNEQSIIIQENPPDLQPKAPTEQNRSAPKSTKKTVAPNVESVDYIINLEGNFVGLMSYLQSLEKQPFLSSLRGIKIAAQAVTSAGSGSPINSGTIDTTVEGTFYYLKE